MYEISIQEKRNQLERLSAETINKDFLKSCRNGESAAPSEDIRPPWSVENNQNWENMPFVVWAKVIKKKDVQAAPPNPPPTKAPANPPPTTTVPVHSRAHRRGAHSRGGHSRGAHSRGAHSRRGGHSRTTTDPTWWQNDRDRRSDETSWRTFDPWK